MARWSKMTYEMVAGTVKQTRDGYGPLATMGTIPAIAYAAVAQIGEDFASIFEKDNPRFNRARFLRACGLKKTP